MATNTTRPANLSNINVTQDSEGRHYIRQTIRPLAPMVFQGRLGGEVELDHVGKDNIARANFSLATDWQEVGQDLRTTGWVRVTAWRGAAEAIAQHVSKGDQIIITASEVVTLVSLEANGVIRTNDSGEPRVSTEITVDSFRLLANGGSRNNARNGSVDFSEEASSATGIDFGNFNGSNPPADLDDAPF